MHSLVPNTKPMYLFDGKQYKIELNAINNQPVKIIKKRTILDKTEQHTVG